jgi:hypothetical protein
MMSKVFISFKSEDVLKVWALRGLSKFKNVHFEMDDVSLREAINSRDEYYIRSVIRPKIKSSNVCLCLVGENTWRSRKWVPWEIRLAKEEGKRIYAMRFKGLANVITPSVLDEVKVVPFDWDVDRLFRWI